MVRLSNNLLGILNVVVFVLSIPIFIAGVWLANQASSECEKFLDKPMIVLGVFLMAVSLAGIIGACCRVSCLLWLYLCVMFILILLIFCFTVFAFVVTNKGAGEAVSGRGYKEYKLGDYSHWLQKRVESGKNWDRIRSCVQESKVCQKLANKGDSVQQFFRQNLSPLQVSSSSSSLCSSFPLLKLRLIWNNNSLDVASHRQNVTCSTLMRRIGVERSAPAVRTTKIARNGITTHLCFATIAILARPGS